MQHIGPRLLPCSGEGSVGAITPKRLRRERLSLSHGQADAMTRSPGVHWRVRRRPAICTVNGECRASASLLRPTRRLARVQWLRPHNLAGRRMDRPRRPPGNHSAPTTTSRTVLPALQWEAAQTIFGKMRDCTAPQQPAWRRQTSGPPQESWCPRTKVAMGSLYPSSRNHPTTDSR